MEIKSEKVLESLVITYQNDFCGGYKGDDFDRLNLIFLELIVAMTRYVNDIRYCSDPKCQCSPESEIAKLSRDYETEIFDVILSGELGMADLRMGKLRDYIKSFREAST